MVLRIPVAILLLIVINLRAGDVFQIKGSSGD
jgi:hypothetical protein